MICPVPVMDDAERFSTEVSILLFVPYIPVVHAFDFRKISLAAEDFFRAVEKRYFIQEPGNK